jgi:7-cyano-7-deazaguanine synthase in queuosine biosynthesis
MSFHAYRWYGGKHDPELNMLKYVCRQLYAETAALELRHNTLMFEQSQCTQRQLEPDRQLIAFAGMCAPSEFAWVKNILLNTKALGMYYYESLEYF